METCREYSFSGYIDIGNCGYIDWDGKTSVLVEGVGWITENGEFAYQIDYALPDDDEIDRQIFELFQIQNRGRLPQVCIDLFESGPDVAVQEPNQNSAVGR